MGRLPRDSLHSVLYPFYSIIQHLDLCFPPPLIPLAVVGYGSDFAALVISLGSETSQTVGLHHARGGNCVHAELEAI